MVQNCSYFFNQFLEFRQFTIISVVVAVLFSVYLLIIMKKRRIGKVATVAFFIGSVLNALDRWKDGCVIDYLDFFGLFKYNVFDLMICVSSAILFYLIVFKTHKEVNI
jgi:lipoprotein signal peptidase